MSKTLDIVTARVGLERHAPLDLSRLLGSQIVELLLGDMIDHDDVFSAKILNDHSLRCDFTCMHFDCFVTLSLPGADISSIDVGATTVAIYFDFNTEIDKLYRMPLHVTPGMSFEGFCTALHSTREFKELKSVINEIERTH